MELCKPGKPSRLLFRRLKWWLFRNFVCPRLGHRLGSDRGILLGSRFANRWCDRCNRMVNVPFEEEY